MLHMGDRTAGHFGGNHFKSGIGCRSVYKVVAGAFYISQPEMTYQSI